jgi:histone-lysine N-methyltransferase SETD3
MNFNLRFAVLVSLCIVARAVTAKQAERAGDGDAAFMQWFEDIGAKANGVKLMQFPPMGRGVGASKDVKKYDPVISVPIDYVICRKTALKTEDQKARVAFGSLRDESDLVALFVLRELAMGKESKWAPYLSVLPKDVALPCFFTDTELAALQDPHEAHKARETKNNYKNQFDNLKKTSVVDKVFSGTDKKLQNKYNNLGMYMWASALVGSRALTMQGKRFLVPLSDMFNYQWEGVERVADNGAHFLRTHKLSDKSFDVSADRDCKAGEQLFEDYGDNDNYLYLQHHGFVPNNNPFNCVNVPMLKIDAPNEQRLGLLSVLRVTKHPHSCFSDKAVMSMGKIDAPSYIQQFLLVAAMSENQAEKCIGLMEAAKSQGLNRAPLERCFQEGYDLHSIEKKVWGPLVFDAFKAQLESYPTSFEDDDRILTSASSGTSSLAVELTWNEQLAIQFRMGKKKLLQSIVHRLRPIYGEEAKGRADSINDADADEGDDIGDSGVSGDGGGGGSAESAAEEDARYALISKNFNEWIEKGGLPHNKLTTIPVKGMRLGTIASEDITPEEVYISVPEELCMDRESAVKCPMLGPAIKRLNEKFPKGDAFHELLFHLLVEKFVRKEESPWAPYMAVIPGPEEMEQPAYYTDEEMGMLEGSPLKEMVEAYKDQLKSKYAGVKKHVLNTLAPEFPEVLTPAAFSFKYYKWAHATLDSRAIWWGQGRHLVPLLDMINCMEGPNPKRLHKTDMDASGKNAETKAPWGFKKGEQVFENYGQPNHIYMQ